jgi:hypothetical protein
MGNVICVIVGSLSMLVGVVIGYAMGSSDEQEIRR